MLVISSSPESQVIGFRQWAALLWVVKEFYELITVKMKSYWF